jgi:hypothetical protein
VSLKAINKNYDGKMSMKAVARTQVNAIEEERQV